MLDHEQRSFTITRLMPPGIARTAAILLAIVIGAFLPQAHSLAWLIRWLVMAMLFLVFLQTRLTQTALHRTHGWLLLANIAMGFAAWGLGWLIGGRDVALAAFFAGITPTATAAPVGTSHSAEARRPRPPRSASTSSASMTTWCRSSAPRGA